MKHPETAGPKRWNRKSVVEAAAKLSDTEGYDALTLVLLADRLGIKPPSLYKHIGGLDDLKSAIQAYATRALMEEFSLAATGREGDEAILAVADAYRAFVKAHPGLQVAMSRPSATARRGAADPEFEAANQQLMAASLRLLAGKRLDKRKSIHALRTLRSLIHGFVMLETTGAFAIAVSLDQSYRYAIENFIRGLQRG